MAKKPTTTPQDGAALEGAAETGAALKTFAVLSPVKIGGKRFAKGTVDLDPEADDTQELIAFGAIGDPPPERPASKASKDKQPE